jgi:hypothetical protein
MATQTIPRVSPRRQIGHFVLHYFEMCLPMCVGFMVLDMVYFWGRASPAIPIRSRSSQSSRSWWSRST